MLIEKACFLKSEKKSPRFSGWRETAPVFKNVDRVFTIFYSAQSGILESKIDQKLKLVIISKWSGFDICRVGVECSEYNRLLTKWKNSTTRIVISLYSLQAAINKNENKNPKKLTIKQGKKCDLNMHAISA